MNKFWIMLSQAYMTKLKSKSFIVLTAIMIVAILIMGNMSRIIDMFSDNDKANKIAVMDETNIVFNPLQQQLKTINKDIILEKVEKDEDELQKAIDDKKYEGYITLSLDENKLPIAIFKAPSMSNTELTNDLKQALQSVKSVLAASQLNLTTDQLAILSSPVQFKEVSLANDAKSAEEMAQARGLVYILLFAIYFAVIFYSSMVGMEIANEKSSRVMEILISSASPTQQMFAKIIGVALLGLTQMIFLLGVAYFSIKQNLDTMTGGFFDVFGFGETSVSTIVYAVLFFLLGYLLYSTLAAFLGSLVSRVEDAQQMMMPMTFLIMIGFFIAMAGLSNPEAGFVTFTSYIPFFTPMIMFMRVGMLNLPLWEGLVGVTILVVSIAVMAIIGARIYRGGVLLYGKSTFIANIKKALQLSKNQ